MALSYCTLEGQAENSQATERIVKLLTQEKKATRLLDAQRAVIEGLRPEEQQLQIAKIQSEDIGDIDDIERVEEDIRDVSRVRFAVSQFMTVSEYVAKSSAATRTNQDTRPKELPSSNSKKNKSLTMSDTYGNLGRLGPGATVDNNFETKHDAKIGTISKDEIPNAPSIYHLYGSCLTSYGLLLLSLETDSLCSTHLTTSLVPTVKDEFSRLRIWGEQTYAVLPQNARRSLDERLREDEDTKEVVIRCLRRLNNHIKKAIEQTKRYSSTVDVDAEDEEYSSLSDESDAAQEDLKTNWEIRFRNTIEFVFEGIRSLYRVSILLRRPRDSSKYLRSSNPTIPAHDTLRVTLDYAHVSEKIRQWRRLTMRSRLGGDERHVVTEEEIQLKKENEQQEIADIAFFCQRLAWANLCRREQFKYWIDHPDVPETQTTASDVGKEIQQKDRIMSAIPASLSTVAKSALEDNTEVGQSRTKAKSAVGQPNTTRVPDVPKCSKNGPNFECPFCHVILSSGLMQKREIWEQHVFEDLRPYVCSFESCPTPGRLFESRHDRVYHEQQMHRRMWVCPDGCTKDLPTKADMVQHLLRGHSNVLDDHQILTYADMCERDMNDSRKDACLICSEEMSLSQLYEHLATHMEEIAFFVLPVGPDDDEDEQINKILEESTMLAKAENEKAIAEAKTEHEKMVAEAKAKALADADEAAKSALEEEFKKNASISDADKAPLQFTDAVDRRFKLPWHLVKSWKGMEALITRAFANIERIGPHVANGHYHLLGPNNETILPQVWDIVVQPGWHIKMQLWPLPPDPPEDKVNSDLGESPFDVRPVVEQPSKQGHTQVSANKSNAKAGKKKQVPAFTKWMLGGTTRPRPKGAQNPAAGVNEEAQDISRSHTDVNE
ncbi:hypothetical protein KCV07_g8721, partial [Aureobasidium melanogenum]